MAAAGQSQTFFEVLKDLARSTERRIEKCKEDVEKINPREREFCAPVVLDKLTNLKTEMKTLNKNLGQTISSLEEDNAKVAAIGCLARPLNDSLTAALKAVETHLCQYGYVPIVVPEDTVEESVESTQEKITTTGTPADHRPKPRDKNRTPQMEDFGISAETIRMMNSVIKNKSDGNQKPSTNQNKNQKSSTITRGPAVPKIFEHDGLICTPSLCNMDRSVLDIHAALASPVETQMPFVPETRLPHQTKAKLDFFRTSPEPHRSVPSNTRSIQPAGSQPLKSAPVQRFLGEMPEEPELTYSLEALTEMTGMFQINCKANPSPSVPSQVHSKEPTPLCSYTSSEPEKPLPRDPVLLSAGLQDNKENATPPEPQLQVSSRVPTFKESSREPVPRNKSVAELLAAELPPSPKLTSNY